MRMCISNKLHAFGFVFFIALDNSPLHMCLCVVVDQIMLLRSNQMEWILMDYQSSVLSYDMCVSAEESLLGLLLFYPQMDGF